MYADKIPARTIQIDHQESLYFGGTSYLGIHANPDFGALVTAGIQKYGTNYGASRLGVDIPVFDQMESKLAAWLEAPSTVVVSSGTLAGRLILEVLGDDYQYHYSPNAHIAINPLYESHQPHLFESWIEETLEDIHQADVSKHVITLNSIDALTALKPDLSWAGKLPKTKEVIIVLDDSHGIGILGPEGRGVYPELKKLHDRSIMIASLGKAMGLPAGLIAGPIEYTSKVKQHPLFGGSSPMIPAYADAYLNADDIYATSYHKLIQNIKSFKHGVHALNRFQYADDFSIFCTQEHHLAAYLINHQVKISHFAYPSPQDNLYTRVILNALQTLEDIEKLVRLINKY